jgi:hypothetical protein
MGNGSTIYLQINFAGRYEGDKRLCHCCCFQVMSRQFVTMCVERLVPGKRGVGMMLFRVAVYMLEAKIKVQ